MKWKIYKKILWKWEVLNDVQAKILMLIMAMTSRRRPVLELKTTTQNMWSCSKFAWELRKKYGTWENRWRNFQMYNDVNTALKEFHTPRALFTHPHKRDPTELAGAEANPTETPQDNVVRSPLLTHLSLTNLPIVYAIEAPAYPTPCTHADAISAAHLASEIN